MRNTVLKDRKQDFIDNNMTLCEEDCEYKGYNFETKNVNCECPIKLNIMKITQLTIDKNKLYDRFKDIKNVINLDLMKCYKVLFTKDAILYNIGNYIVILLITIFQGYRHLGE